MKASEMTRIVKNRFYKLRRIILSGVPDKGQCRVHIVEISMKAEREVLIQRCRHIKANLKIAGFGYEYCLSSPVEQVEGLSTLCGLIRTEKVVKADDLEVVLAGVWQGCREANVVVRSCEGSELRKYMREVLLRPIVEGEYRMKHLVQSRGWVLADGAVSGYEWFHRGS